MKKTIFAMSLALALTLGATEAFTAIIEGQGKGIAIGQNSNA